MATAVLRPVTEPASTAPTPKQIDEIVAHFEQVRDEAELADERFEDCKDHLIALVKRFGYVPAGAEQSLRLQGALTTLTVTTGSTVTTKEDEVALLQKAMAANGQGDLFASMFSERTRYSLQKDAEKNLRLAKLPARVFQTFVTLYARCFDVKKKSPSVTIERLGEKSNRRKKGTK